MSWQDHLTAMEKGDLIVFATARDACRDEMEKFSKEIARIRNRAVLRNRRKGD